MISNQYFQGENPRKKPATAKKRYCKLSLTNVRNVPWSNASGVTFQVNASFECWTTSVYSRKYLWTALPAVPRARNLGLFYIYTLFNPKTRDLLGAEPTLSPFFIPLAVYVVKPVIKYNSDCLRLAADSEVTLEFRQARLPVLCNTDLHSSSCAMPISFHYARGAEGGLKIELSSVKGKSQVQNTRLELVCILQKAKNGNGRSMMHISTTDKWTMMMGDIRYSRTPLNP